MSKQISAVVLTAFLVLGLRDISAGIGWSDLKARLLPDDSFAAVEYDENGNKQRHCPHHDENGRLDAEQLIFVLGTFDKETWCDPETKEKAKSHLEKHYHRLKIQIMTDEPDPPINIRAATLVELVSLPSIGPVLAVRIVEYRSSHPAFMRIEEIQKVEGIGGNVFNAVRHYISCD